MLVNKLDRLNQLNVTLSEVNEIRSQLLAELERINLIEKSTITDISDLQSEILSTTQLVVPDRTKLSDATLKGCKFETINDWEVFENYISGKSILRSEGVMYVTRYGKITESSSLPGGTNSPLQKAVDFKYGYTQARYEQIVTDWNPAGEWNLPEMQVCMIDQKKNREYWHANHIRKQIWYDFRNAEFWKTYNIDWKRDDMRYWLQFENLVKLSDEVKSVMATCPDRQNYGGFEHEINQFVADKLAYIEELQEAITF